MSQTNTASVFPIGVLNESAGIPPIIGRARLEMATRQVPTLVLDSSLAFARIEIQKNIKTKKIVILRYGEIRVRLMKFTSFPATCIQRGWSATIPRLY